MATGRSEIVAGDVLADGDEIARGALSPAHPPTLPHRFFSLPNRRSSSWPSSSSEISAACFGVRKTFLNRGDEPLSLGHAVEVRGCDQYGGRLPSLGDQDRPSTITDPAHDLRGAGLELGDREHVFSKLHGLHVFTRWSQLVTIIWTIGCDKSRA